MNAESRPAIEVRGLTKVYGEGALAFTALKGIDLTVPRGEVLMLSGPSGSGKTTLLSILGCVLSPTAGSVRLFDEELVARPDRDLPRLRLSYIGFVFQGHNLIASLDALDNVTLMLALRGFPFNRARQEARRLLVDVGLGDRVHYKPEDMSGGQRQRVAIARALAGDPPLILADEPTASLDAHNGLQVTELLKRLCHEHGHTAIIVTHDNRIFHLADRILHIEDGELRHE